MPANIAGEYPFRTPMSTLRARLRGVLSAFCRRACGPLDSERREEEWRANVTSTRGRQPAHTERVLRHISNWTIRVFLAYGTSATRPRQRRRYVAKYCQLCDCSRGDPEHDGICANAFKRSTVSGLRGVRPYFQHSYRLRTSSKAYTGISTGFFTW